MLPFPRAGAPIPENINDDNTDGTDNADIPKTDEDVLFDY